MAISKAQQRATANYVKSNYDRIEIKPPKGTKEKWQAKAEAAGKSLQRFIIDAVEKAPD
jgi:hypothetical protein